MDKREDDDVNPYRVSEARESGAPDDRPYYSERIEGVPFRSMVDFMAQSLPRPIAWLITASIRIKSLLGLEPLATNAFGPVGSGVRLPREEMPARPMSRWAARLEDLADLGFEPLGFSLGDHIGAKESAAVLLLNEPGTVFATLEWFRMPGASGIEEQWPMELNSLMEVRSNNPYQAGFSDLLTVLTPAENLCFSDVFTPEWVDADFQSDSMTLKNAVRRHMKRMDCYTIKSVPRISAIEAHDALSRRRFGWMLENGLIRKLTPTEVTKVRRNRLE